MLTSPLTARPHAHPSRDGGIPPGQDWEWSIAVTGRNEAASLPDCLHAVAQACRGRRAHVTLLLNGTTDGSLAAAVSALRADAMPCRIYVIPFADKSNALNQFIHAVRPAADMYCFVDAYAEVRPDALRLLASRLDGQPGAHAAAALPSAGRNAAAMRHAMQTWGGLHGSLFALRRGFVDTLADRKLRLPVGLYRGDSVLGSFVLHDLDALAGGWDLGRLTAVPDATWETRRLSLLRWRDLRRQWRRMVQQGRGRLEMQAFKQTIYASGFAALPMLADRMILDWVAGEPAVRTPSLLRDPFAALALYRVRHAGQSTPATLVPNLVWEHPCRDYLHNS